MSEISDIKELAIDDLPDCYAKEMLQNMVVDSGHATVNIVASIGVIRDWSAYIGFPSYNSLKEEKKNESMFYYCTQVRYPAGVASNGDKLDSKTAAKIFPQFCDLKYRN